MNNKIYYHYCSVDTFYNILQTDIIRFGNPLKMNDSAESIWFPAMVKDFLKVGLGQFTRNYTQTTKRGLLTTNKG